MSSSSDVISSAPASAPAVAAVTQAERDYAAFELVFEEHASLYAPATVPDANDQAHARLLDAGHSAEFADLVCGVPWDRRGAAALHRYAHLRETATSAMRLAAMVLVRVAECDGDLAEHMPLIQSAEVKRAAKMLYDNEKQYARTQPAATAQLSDVLRRQRAATLESVSADEMRDLLELAGHALKRRDQVTGTVRRLTPGGELYQRTLLVYRALVLTSLYSIVSRRYTGSVYGVGLYARASLLPASCAANTVVFTRGPCVRIYAVRAIRRGETLSVTPMSDLDIMTEPQRARALARSQPLRFKTPDAGTQAEAATIGDRRCECELCVYERTTPEVAAEHDRLSREFIEATSAIIIADAPAPVAVPTAPQGPPSGAAAAVAVAAGDNEVIESLADDGTTLTTTTVVAGTTAVTTPTPIIDTAGAATTTVAEAPAPVPAPVPQTALDLIRNIEWRARALMEVGTVPATPQTASMHTTAGFVAATDALMRDADVFVAELAPLALRVQHERVVRVTCDLIVRVALHVVSTLDFNVRRRHQTDMQAAQSLRDERARDEAVRRLTARQPTPLDMCGRAVAYHFYRRHETVLERAIRAYADTIMYHSPHTIDPLIALAFTQVHLFSEAARCVLAHYPERRERAALLELYSVAPEHAAAGLVPEEHVQRARDARTTFEQVFSDCSDTADGADSSPRARAEADGLLLARTISRISRARLSLYTVCSAFERLGTWSIDINAQIDGDFRATVDELRALFADPEFSVTLKAAAAATAVDDDDDDDDAANAIGTLLSLENKVCTAAAAAGATTTTTTTMIEQVH